MTASRLVIVVDDLAGPEVRALLADHLAGMHEVSPAGGVHALDVEALRGPDITFWTAWATPAGWPTSTSAPGSARPADGRRLAGCAALRELDPHRGELKSFRTHPAHLRRGVASALLDHLVDVGRARGYTWLGLETGSGAAFEPAHALYERHGFTARGAFGDYPDDPFSRFLERRLSTHDR